ncbi:hypothetical protein ACFQRB_20680 [Halobaculum litoreum]|uniref:Uncharacterized protein n=1 Tax=Halobaculum litoreum TaxID=3031998 RepID=A0ABD5XWB6_9EURY
MADDHREPWQFLAYVVASVVLNVVIGIGVALAIGIAAVVLLIPFGVLGGLGFLLLSTVEPLGAGLLVVAGVLFGLSCSSPPRSCRCPRCRTSGTTRCSCSATPSPRWT